MLEGRQSESLLGLSSWNFSMSLFLSGCSSSYLSEVFYGKHPMLTKYSFYSLLVDETQIKLSANRKRQQLILPLFLESLCGAIFVQDLMIAEGPMVKGWAPSTAPKIVQLVDQFVIHYPQANVRKTTTKLLASLFKKGNQEQRTNIMTLLMQRIKSLNSMGKSSEQFLSLVTKIFQIFPQEYEQEKKLIFNQVLCKVKEIFTKVTSNKEYALYSLCSNMIDFGQEFKPYLLEANGCLKCFGRPDVNFEQINLNSVRQQLRVHINNIEWVLRRKYEMNNLQVNFIKKRLNFKSMLLYYLDQHGAKVQLGKYGNSDTIPSFNITTNTIGITFEFSKTRRSHIACLLCSGNEEYAVLCSNCVSKLIDIEASAKVVAGHPSKINRELTQSFRTMNDLRGQLQDFAASVSAESKICSLKSRIVYEMQVCYTNIIQNLRLIRSLNQSQLKGQKQKYSEFVTDCYSCHFFQLVSCVHFVSECLNNKSVKVGLDSVIDLIGDFKFIYFHNRVHSLNDSLSCILSELFNRVSIDNFKQIQINATNSRVFAKLIVNIIRHLKTQPTNQNLLQDVKLYVLNTNNNSFFNISQKTEIFVMLALNTQHYPLLTANLQPQQLQEINRLTPQEFNCYSSLLDFQVSSVLQLAISSVFKLFLSLVPEERVPVSRLNMADAGYLKLIKNQPPVITEELILQNIVFSPNPIIKLNLFKLLPKMIENLPLQQSVELIRQLCQYKPLWNTYIIQTVDNFNRMLDSVEKERKLMLCLDGYANSKEDIYFEHIFKILTPQRTNFIVRLQIPEKQMQKEEKNKGGPVEYIYLPIREVKSEDLKSDTIGGLHEWITDQIRKMGQDMPFDLIVQGNIVDDLDLSLEIIYKKIVQKEVKRQIGNKTYDFFRVIYRIQGIFGEANERNSGNPRDQKLEQCTNFSSHLLNRLTCKKTGLDVLMEMIPGLDVRSAGDQEKKEKLIKILGIMFKNETIIQRIVEWEHANSVLNMTIKSISLNKKQFRQTQVLLQMCSKIIDQANLQMIKIRKNSEVHNSRKASEAEMDVEADSEECLKTVKHVLEKAKEADEGGFKQLSRKLTKLLPFCTKDDMSASRYLYEFFEVNKVLEIKYLSKLSWFLQFISALSQSYMSFKQICSEEGITTKVVEMITFGIEVQQVQKLKENVENIQTSLALCKGLVQGDLHLQDHLFQKGLLQAISKISLENRVKVGRIPSLCYDFIKYFHEGKIISPQVHEYFAGLEKIKKQAVGQNKLKKLAMVKAKKQKALDTYKDMLSQSTDGLQCTSCKEGYVHKKDVLGIYLYSTKTEIYPIEGWWKDPKKVHAITSTSYFETIHLECHLKAMKDDLKIQKTEWDGALIRNSEVLCNNWCPIKGPQTTQQDFDRSLGKYFEKNNKNVSYWVVISDLNGLMERFSKQFDFSKQTHGSGPTHNAKLIPVLISLASHLLKNKEDLKLIKDGMAYIEEHLTKKPSLVHLYFCLLLFTTPKSSFNNKKQFCLKLIDHLQLQNFKELKPFYIELAMIESIVKISHGGADASSLMSHLSTYVSKDLPNVLQSFEQLAESYKNDYVHWQTIQQAKQHFQS